MFGWGSIVIDEPGSFLFRVQQVITDTLNGTQALFCALVGNEADGEVGKFSHLVVPKVHYG